MPRNHPCSSCALALLFTLPLACNSLSSTTIRPDHCPAFKNCSQSFFSIPVWFPFSSLGSSYDCGIDIISCDGNVTQIDLDGRNLILKRILYHNNALEVKYSDSYKKDWCKSPHNFTTLPERLLNYGFRISGPNLTIFKCKQANDALRRPPFSLKNESCDDGSVLYLYYNPLGRTRLPFDAKRIGCPAYAIPAGVAESSDSNMSVILNSGFMLQWKTEFDCLQCNKSGGKCRIGKRGAPICLCENDSVHRFNCSDSTGKPNIWLKVLIGVSAAVFSFIAASLCSIYVHRYRERNKKRSPSADSLTRSIYSSKTSSSYDLESKSFHQRCGGRVVVFPYKELEEATDSFSPSNELGDGGFGAVYFGKLNDGREVAVKRLYENNYKRVEQFMNEIEILSGILHPNLVRLYGCTSRHSRELLLVYEYINNGTLGDHIHGLPATEGRLTWKVRLSIAVETAEALAYLHNLEPPIIHRDVKTNNILLDKDFHVKVADFGLSRLFPFDATHVSTAPQGTPGYVDPDYHKCYQLTDKSDVYSYGVVLAELISSFPAVDITRHRHEINLANMAMNKIHNHELHEFVDSSLGFETDEWVNTTVRAVAELAFRCLAPEREVRPTMDEVVKSLRQTITSGGIESEERFSSPEIETHQTSALLKSYSAMSPKAVTDKWPSYYTTPTNSG